MKQAVIAIVVLVALAGIIPLSQGNLIVAGVLYACLLGVGVLYTRTQPSAPHDYRDNN